jgi:DNA repair exonuclease SbcCD ATPase subunit
MKHKRNKKGDGNNSLFDLAVGISMSDENEELEERIKTLTRELDEKNKIIENLSKGGGGGDDFSKTVLQKVNILEEHNKKLQQLIQQMESFTPNKETLNTILDKIKELQQHQYKLDQSINELTQFKPFKMNNEPLIEIDHDFKSKTSNLIPLLQSTKREKKSVLTS